MKNTNVITTSLITKQFASMMTLQHKTNVLAAGPDYTAKRLGWDTAIFVELGELLTSVGYKWWKDNPVDMLNAKTEVVDVWHFLMSKLISDSSVQFPNIETQIDVLSTQFAPAFMPISINQGEMEMMHASLPYNPNNTIHYSKLLIKRIMNAEDYQVILIAFMELCASLRMSFSDLFNRYMIKNVLNDLRQQHGYKDGTYQKQWIPHPAMNHEGTLEDNAVAAFLVESSTEPKSSYEDIHQILNKYYVEMIAAQVK